MCFFQWVSLSNLRPTTLSVVVFFIYLTEKNPHLTTGYVYTELKTKNLKSKNEWIVTHIRQYCISFMGN